jgi:hypothetical protein
VTYYPLQYGGAFTGYIPGASPYIAGGGYSSGEPAGYPMPVPPRFSKEADSTWLTPSEDTFERRHVDHEVNLTTQDWMIILTASSAFALLAFLILRP